MDGGSGGAPAPPHPPRLLGLRPRGFLRNYVYNDVKVVKVFKVVKNSCNNVVVILDDGAGGAPRTPPCWPAFGRRRRSGAAVRPPAGRPQASWPAGRPAIQPGRLEFSAPPPVALN